MDLICDWPSVLKKDTHIQIRTQASLASSHPTRWPPCPLFFSWGGRGPCPFLLFRAQWRHGCFEWWWVYMKYHISGIIIYRSCLGHTNMRITPPKGKRQGALFWKRVVRCPCPFSISSRSSTSLHSGPDGAVCVRLHGPNDVCAVAYFLYWAKVLSG